MAIMNSQEMGEFMEFYEALQLFKRMKQPQPDPTQQQPTPQETIQNSNAAATGTIDINEVNDLKAQIQELKAQLIEAQSQLSATQNQLSAAQARAEAAELGATNLSTELQNLKRQVSLVEAARSMPIEEQVEEALAMSGDDWYEQNRANLSDKTNQEKHDIIKDFMDVQDETLRVVNPEEWQKRQEKEKAKKQETRKKQKAIPTVNFNDF